MGRKRVVFILALTIFTTLVLAFFVGHTIYSVNQRTARYCYEDLADVAKDLAATLRLSTETDRTILQAMAALIAQSGEADADALSGLMESYNPATTYMSHVALLRPDGAMLIQGRFRNMAGTFDFAAEAAKGAYISDVVDSVREPGEKVILNAVPVVQGGVTIAMLYGVVRVKDLAEKYITDIYDGHAYVYLLDGDSGDFFLDSWHDILYNFRDFADRTLLPGYSYERVIADLSAGLGGEFGLISRTKDAPLYLRYDPVGVNHWFVMVSVEKTYAMEKQASISALLYRMAAVIGLMMFLYMLCVSYNLWQAYRQTLRLGSEDQVTGLKNRNAFDRYIEERRCQTFPRIVCVYADADGLHEVNNRRGHAAGDAFLRAIADALKAELGGEVLFRVGGDEFVAFSATRGEEACQAALARASAAVEARGYHMSFGIAAQENTTGLDAVTREADEQMLLNKSLYYQQNDRRHR